MSLLANKDAQSLASVHSKGWRILYKKINLAIYCNTESGKTNKLQYPWSCTEFINLSWTIQSEGGATLELSWTSKTNPWALTLFFQLNAPYFASIEVLGYICNCMRQTSPKVLLGNCYFTKVVRKHGSRYFTEMCNFRMQCFSKNCSELLNHLNLSKLIC